MRLQLFCWLLLAGATSLAHNTSITFPHPWELNGENLPQLHGAPELSPDMEMPYYVAYIGLRMIKDLLQSSENVIISPLNIYACLGILNLATAGETNEEIRSVLGRRNADQSIRSVVKFIEGVSYASALFLDQNFVPKADFVNSVTERYETAILNMDVKNGAEAKNSINSWVSYYTNGTITNLIERDIGSETKMVVVSALLFNGKWLQSFSPAATTLGKFHVDDGIATDVQLMHLSATVPVVKNSHLDAIGLPYQEQGMMMYLILPKTRGVASLKKFLSHLNVNSLKKLKKESVHEDIIMTIPKLKIDGKFALGKALQHLGVASVFNPAKANFSNLADFDSGLFVSDFYHSVHFEMNEEGTIASAASASILTKSSKYVFQATRPFIFVITDSNNLILFMGAVTNP